jgi:hypothetical protein
VNNGHLETYVKDRFGVGLCRYLEQKVEEENLHDYEIASTLNVCGASISKYRKACGLKKANGFSRRFLHEFSWIYMYCFFRKLDLAKGGIYESIICVCKV